MLKLTPWLAACAAGTAFGQSPSPSEVNHLPDIEVRGPRDAAIGTADSASEGAAERASYQARPKLRPGDIVEAVPGVVATQHSGDGKANQYFLRGFNLDHGTDFAVSVDGMPVNMPTHGHGQGFADLNFLIPELVSGVRYRKGPYFAHGGDFSLAGAATLDYSALSTRPSPRSRSAQTFFAACSLPARAPCRIRLGSVPSNSRATTGRGWWRRT